MPGVSRPAALELINVCYKSFSLNFGGDGAGGTEEVVLEFLAVAFSSISVDFSLFLVLVLLFDDVAPLGCCCGSGCVVF